MANQFIPQSFEILCTRTVFTVQEASTGGYELNRSTTLPEIAELPEYAHLVVRSKQGLLPMQKYLAVVQDATAKPDPKTYHRILQTAWLLLTEVVQERNQELIAQYLDIGRQMSKQTELVCSQARQLRHSAECAQEELVTSLVKLGYKRSSVYQIMDDPNQRSNFLALAPYYEVPVPEAKQVTFKEPYLMADLEGYTPHKQEKFPEPALLETHPNTSKYSPEEYATAPKAMRMGKRFQSIELSVEEDNAVLQTMWYVVAESQGLLDESFKRHDRQGLGILIEYDNYPAPLADDAEAVQAWRDYYESLDRRDNPFPLSIDGSVQTPPQYLGRKQRTTTEE